MKRKQLLTLAFATYITQAVSGQTLVNSRTTDNWYVGVNAGLNVKTTHVDHSENLNPHGSLRIGRYWTPVAGWLIEGTAFVRDRQFGNSTTFVKATNLNLLGTLNLSNWFGGYHGQPRRFEVAALAGVGWNHVWNAHYGMHANDLTSKIAMDFILNVGKARAWQFYLEPGINYNLDRYTRPRYNINYSALQLSVGINYKLGNSNGTHNFQTAQLRDQYEIDLLNQQVNELRSSVTAKDRQLAVDDRTIKDLREQLEAARQQKPTVVQQVTRVVNNNVLQPTVIFGLGKSSVDAAQMASVAMIAKYMKNHPDAHILIKGYASPEGDPVKNQQLSEARAASVRDALIQRYGISSSRLSIQGMGATDELFDELDFNRVATFTDTTK